MDLITFTLGFGAAALEDWEGITAGLGRRGYAPKLRRHWIIFATVLASLTAPYMGFRLSEDSVSAWSVVDDLEMHA